jgi:hypothetical protein
MDLAINLVVLASSMGDNSRDDAKDQSSKMKTHHAWWLRYACRSEMDMENPGKVLVLSY